MSGRYYHNALLYYRRMRVIEFCMDRCTALFVYYYLPIRYRSPENIFEFLFRYKIQFNNSNKKKSYNTVGSAISQVLTAGIQGR